MLRLLVLAAALATAAAGWRWFARLSRHDRRRVGRAMAWVLAATFLLGLILTGRLHWIAGGIALLLARFGRLLPFLLRVRQQRAADAYTRQRRTAQAQQQSPPREDGAMTTTKARAILEVPDDATREQIVAAHRRLMRKVHPDTGGSTYLASQINQAKDLLLGRC